jgi:orotate phosphoribosyltransferase
VVEDLISTGMSSLQAVDAVRAAGASVVGVVAVFQYGLPVADEAFARAACPFTTLTDYRTVIRVAAEEGRIRPEDLSLLDAWSADPKAWSDAWLTQHP